tara:strand:- start:1508 stop:3418 length:1911 start_codon:yes stop_codon:yes gene_type:complete
MLPKTLLRSIVALLCVCTLQAQMTPSAPVQNFRFPHFGENGYTQWVLQGGKGIYDSAEQIRIEEMALRVYSGDERMALEMTMDSPEATLLTAENRAVSDGPIEIVGGDFKVSGVGWTWNGRTKEIEVKFDVVVEFTQGMAGVLTGAVAPEGAAVERTEIHSRSLLLHTTAEAYRFTFTDSVHAVSGEMDLTSEVLVAVADAPKGKEGDSSTVAGGAFGAIRQLIATDQVVIHQGGHVLKASHAEFRLREQAAEFTGNPEILAASGAYLSGATIRSQEGRVFVTGNADDGRAQLIVSQAEGLGVLGAQIESAQTIVLADSITMRELDAGNQFLFDGSVEVMSGLMIMYSNQLTLFADQPAKGAATTATPRLVAGDAEMLKVGAVRRVLAKGAVRIEQANKVATSDKVIFYPQEERAELFGSPRVTDGEVIITGDRMELKPSIAVVYSDTDKRVKVVLPEIADLGYEDSQALTLQPDQSQQTPQTPQTPQAPGSETVVQSKTLRMIEETDKTLFRFTESVSVSGTNVHALCGRLDVTAVAVQIAETTESQLEVQTIEAFDNIVFKQTGRVATSDKATIQPIEGKVVLEGNAVVTDEMGKVSGHRMTLLQGQRRAIVEGDRSTGKRATMTLPEMKSRSK